MILGVYMDWKSEIYEKYHQKVLNYIYMKTSNHVVAEDLCGDVFVKVYENLEKYDCEKAAVSTWVYTIAHNIVIDYYRTNKVYAELEETQAVTDNVLEDVCCEETLRELACALGKLDQTERDIIILHYYKGLKLKEIGEALGISYSYTKLLHKKALGELKEIL